MNINNDFISRVNYPDHFIEETNIEKAGSEPDIFCLTEIHRVKEDAVATSKFIADNYREGDLILVEGGNEELTKEEREITLEKYPRFRENMIIKSWDSLEEFRSPEYKGTQNKMEEMCDLLLNMHEMDCTSDQFTPTLRKFALLSGRTLSAEESYLINNDISSDDHKKVKKLIGDCAMHIYDKFTQVIARESFINRNKAMARSITKNFKKGSKIFIIAGRAHFLGVNGVGVAAPDIQKGLAAVRYVLDKHNFVIVTPKEKIADDKPIVEDNSNLSGPSTKEKNAIDKPNANEPSPSSNERKSLFSRVCAFIAKIFRAISSIFSCFKKNDKRIQAVPEKPIVPEQPKSEAENNLAIRQFLIQKMRNIRDEDVETQSKIKKMADAYECPCDFPDLSPVHAH